MRSPVQLRVPLHPSRIAAAAIVSLATASFAACLTLSWPILYDAGAALVLTGWALHRIRLHATRTAPRSVEEILLSSDAVIVVRRRDGRLVAGHVRSSTFVHPWFTSIVWRPDGARLSRTVPLLPDMMDFDDFRRLRVLLRYGRSDATAGDPASQA
jgi:hypothetical protein